LPGGLQGMSLPDNLIGGLNSNAQTGAGSTSGQPQNKPLNEPN